MQKKSIKIGSFKQFRVWIWLLLLNVKLPSDTIIKIKPLPENKIQSIEINLGIEQRINDFKNYDETELEISSFSYKLIITITLYSILP